MGKLTVFNFLSLNGYYKGPDGDTSWHKHGGEENEYSEDMIRKGNILLFGRTTYEMMLSFWPTPDAVRAFPVVAEGMNKAEKIVFSRTMEAAGWNNARVANELEAEVKKLKAGDKDMAVLGSGSIVAQLAEKGLVDEYQIMIDPVIIANGTPMCHNITHQIDLQLISSRVFSSGVVLLCYKPAGKR